MSRCVVTVATGRYTNGALRLIAEVEKFGGGCSMMSWIDCLPPGSPTHRDTPYAFKAFALDAARQAGHEVLLWADASIHILKPLTPLFERIERDGYWIALNGWTNYEWTADSAYKDLFPGVPIEAARELNKQFPQVVATSFGVDLQHQIGLDFFDQYYALANTDAFKGPWGNSNFPGPAWKYHDSMMGACGPADVFGHRHDQTAASLIAWRLGMKLSQCPEVLAYPPHQTDSTILLVAGA